MTPWKATRARGSASDPFDRGGRAAPPTLTHGAPIKDPPASTAQDGRAAPSDRKAHTHATPGGPRIQREVSGVLLAGRESRCLGDLGEVLASCPRNV